MPAVIDRAVEMILVDPPGEATHWSGRVMAKAVGHRSVQRIWAAMACSALGQDLQAVGRSEVC